MILSGDGKPAEPVGGEDDRLGEAQGTIGKGGLRLWIYPREVTGTKTRQRRIVAWILLIAYLGLPWISWNGEPIFKLDIFGRRLVLAGHYFWVQDLPLLLPAIIGSALLVFLVTARFGRIWCGWACPQTVFLQFLFAPVERLIEGRASQRRERDRRPFTPDWIGRKLTKHAVFIGLSVFIGNTALAYFWGMQNLLYAIRNPSSENAMGLTFVLAFSAVFYWVFAYFREQACIMICPYARLQSVLVDERTSMVAYDQGRGEPRGRGPRNAREARDAREGLGDCVDCSQCVLVCPTGIDIRAGNQLECIGCTRCIDACDQTMAARKLKPGLIRYASLDELQGGARGGVPARLLVYGLLACMLLGSSAVMMMRRGELGLDLTRRGRSPYAMLGTESVANSFTLHIRNRQVFRKNLTLEIALPAGQEGARPSTNWKGRSFGISGGQLLSLPLEATVPASLFRSGRLDARLVVSGDGFRESIPITLAGPWRKGG